MLQEARSEAPGQFKPTTLREEMLSARSDTRREHNRNIYHVIPVTGAAIDGRPFAEGKASSYKEIAPGVFVPFTVAGITMKDQGPRVVVAVNPHGTKIVPMLVHHTGAAVVRITVESIHAKHGGHIRGTVRIRRPCPNISGSGQRKTHTRSCLH